MLNAMLIFLFMVNKEEQITTFSATKSECINVGMPKYIKHIGKKINMKIYTLRIENKNYMAIKEKSEFLVLQYRHLAQNSLLALRALYLVKKVSTI